MAHMNIKDEEISDIDWNSLYGELAPLRQFEYLGHHFAIVNTKGIYEKILPDNWIVIVLLETGFGDRIVSLGFGYYPFGQWNGDIADKILDEHIKRMLSNYYANPA